MQVSNKPISGITSEQVQNKLKQVNDETPNLWTTSLIKSPQELTVRMAAINNIQMEKVIENQVSIIQGQNLMMEKMGLGTKLDVKV